MPNYLTVLVVAALVASAACADDKTGAKPAVQASAAPAAAPAPAPAKPAAAPAPANAPAAGIVLYKQTAPAGSSLTFNFQQAGADSRGELKSFVTELRYDEKDLAASSLQVSVQMNSLDTQDKERDETLAGPDLLDTKRHFVASYAATSLARHGSGLEAVGKLTLRGVTKDLRVPFTLKPTANGYELTGSVTIKRLDYGIGQGEWKSTEWVGDDVKLAYKVALVKAPDAR